MNIMQILVVICSKIYVLVATPKFYTIDTGARIILKNKIIHRYFELVRETSQR